MTGALKTGPALLVHREIAAGGHHYAQTISYGLVNRRVRVYGRNITELKQAEQQLSSEARRLQTMVDDRTRDLNEARSETLQLLAVAGEYRDDETSQHTERVQITIGSA